MDSEEIINYLVNSAEVCVNATTIASYPGLIRAIWFMLRNRVCIEFISPRYFELEQGYRFYSDFNTLEDAIKAVERYLGRPITEWVNITKHGLDDELLSDSRVLVGVRNLLHDIYENKVILPDRGDFRLDSALPWESFEEYLESCDRN